MVSHPSVQYVQFYTYGNTARKLQPVTPVKKTTTRIPVQKKIKRLKLYVDPVAIVSIAVAICLLVVMLVGVSQFYTVRDQEAEMAEYVQYLRSENQRLTQLYSESYDINEIRDTATALGMIPAEQIPVKTIDISAP